MSITSINIRTPLCYNRATGTLDVASADAVDKVEDSVVAAGIISKTALALSRFFDSAEKTAEKADCPTEQVTQRAQDVFHRLIAEVADVSVQWTDLQDCFIWRCRVSALITPFMLDETKLDWSRVEKVLGKDPSNWNGLEKLKNGYLHGYRQVNSVASEGERARQQNRHHRADVASH